MSVIVCVKQVPDTETKVHIKPDASGLEEDSIHWIMNPYDEFALEEALQLKEKVEKEKPPTSNNEVEEEKKGQKGEKRSFKVKVITVGPSRARDVLVKALAMGADEGRLIQTDLQLDSHGTSKILSTVLLEEEEPIEIIFTGTLSIDHNASSVPQMLGEFLNLPHVTRVSKFEFFKGHESHTANKMTVQKDIEGGQKMILNIKGPAIIATNKGLNLPRPINMMSMIKAKRKPLKVQLLEKLKIPEPLIQVNWTNFKLPPPRQPVKMISGDNSQEKVNQLIQSLRKETKLF